MVTPPKKLFEGVYLLKGEVGGRPLYLPLLVGEKGALLMDTGCASDVEGLIRPSLKSLGLAPDRLTHIVNTHCDVDHQGGNAAMKRLAPASSLYCGARDRELIEDPDQIYSRRYGAYAEDHGHFYEEDVEKWIRDELGSAQRVDGVFEGGETIELSADWQVEVLHLPGHSRGHLGVYDKKNGVLLGGDAIHGSVYLDMEGQAALCPTYLYVQPYLQTIAKIEELKPAVYVGCHWPVMRGNEVAAFCAESRDFVVRLEQVILSEIRDAGGSGTGLSELCFATGPLMGDWPKEVNYEMCYAVCGHLEDLEQRGLIRRAPGAHPIKFVAEENA